LEGNLLASHLVLTVHDELVIDAVEREIPTLVEAVPRLMDYGPVSEIVPIETDCEISWSTWADKSEYEEANAGRQVVAA
jgi:DNA polymerase I-like protein with 3'-5' exonuclease and polymerase domains